MTYEKAMYWLDEIKRAYIKNGDEDFDRQRKEAIDLAIYCITEWQARKEVSDISRPKGKWKIDEYGIPHCSECNCINNTIHRNYCSNCGADMREEK